MTTDLMTRHPVPEDSHAELERLRARVRELEADRETLLIDNAMLTARVARLNGAVVVLEKVVRRGGACKT